MANRFGDTEISTSSSSTNRFGDAEVSNTPVPALGIAPVPPPQSTAESLSKWAQNVQEDIKYGTDLTGVGTVLKKMDAHGVYNGNPEKVGDFMASLPLGIAKAVEGAGQVATPGQRLQGIGNVVSGVAQAATMPMAFTGLEAGVGPLETVAGKISTVIPSAARAARNFQEVEQAAGAVPIDIGNPAGTALDIRRLAKSGGQMPKVVGDFIKRVLNPDAPDLTFKEARDFYSNATELSSGEKMNLNPKMLRKVGEFTKSLDTSLSEAANQVGKLQQYRDAMNEWHQVKGIQRVSDSVIDLAKSKAAQAALGGGAAYGLYKIFDK